MKIRILERAEHDALLELLDGWELSDGWRGRDFFRRYLVDDPTFEERNVWVAEEAGRLVSCVQIFPRELCVAGVAVPMGGIGSVFTRPEARNSGIAGTLLGCATDAMRERGMELSLLFAARLAFYRRLGWTSWPCTRALLRAPATARSTSEDIEIVPFDPARDLPEILALHAGYSGARTGTTVRDTSGWQANLRLAGNPREEFLVARRQGRVVAYARATVLSSFLMLSELGRELSADPAAEALARLVAAILEPRAGDSLAPPPKRSEEFRSQLLAPAAHDPELDRALAARGFSAVPLPDPSAMLRCLAPAALARRLGVPPPAQNSREAVEAFLQRVLPPERFTTWLADRF
ncbi:MAG TPA: GNAT family N-acetyltransferase [Myxococcota bacterium]|nr:GNAT family N-acetyltransferase [Myxococcota bacterium]